MCVSVMYVCKCICRCLGECAQTHMCGWVFVGVCEFTCVFVHALVCAHVSVCASALVTRFLSSTPVLHALVSWPNCTFHIMFFRSPIVFHVDHNL